MQSDDKALSAAAIQASQTSFANEPLNGVGSDVWKLMWEAAERYSQAEAYPGVDFPATDNGHVCVLCQQPLQSGAQDRLRRFHQFVHNDIATRAQTARLAFQSASAELTNFADRPPDERQSSAGCKSSRRGECSLHRAGNNVRGQTEFVARVSGKGVLRGQLNCNLSRQ